MMTYKRAISPYKVGILCAVLAATGFSFKAIFVKQAFMIADVNPITLLSLRMLFALPFFGFVAFSAFKKPLNLTRWECLQLLGVGFAGYYAASILDFMGLEYITAGLERIILFSYPVLTILISVVFLGKPFDKALILPIILCTFGVVCACISDITGDHSDNNVILGIFLVVASAICYAFYQAFSELLIAKLGVSCFSILAMLIAITAVQIHFIVELPITDLNQPNEIYLICFMMALFSTVLPVFLQSSAIKHIGVAKSVLISTLGPVITLFLGWLLLDEPISFLQIVGMILVLLGILTIKRVKRQK
ncbi:MAG TPA: EamA family transporter [Gammaproteobacteria bacterium]|nr:EamA family transporter [Gammaproteobacteria bacterium]MBK83386.1 EamA family transporter [Gammaproteobacteria bacterium]HBF08080.1 EamA family transporter [Gammaproteobacteria bacterium]HCK91711.1 EamA family transporter [Gammaproteobacteria bacterium]|tara:strand:+ start:8756 stop:9673 length:918 start_codon:yes stop_codon:yes gene_type:complete